MRRGFKRTKQVMAGMLSAVLLMISLLQSSTYIYAAEQTEELTSEEELRTEEILDVQTESEMKEVTHSYMETETTTEKVEESENVETQDFEEKSETETQIKESDAETQQESLETEELAEAETVSETEEQKTEPVIEPALQKKIEKGEFEGVYQFGDAPTDNNEGTIFSINLLSDTNITELVEYLYQQMKEKNETINVESYQISIEEMGDIVTGVLNENPDLYFVHKKYSCSHYEGDTLALEVLLTYDNTLDNYAFQKATNKALAVAKSGMSDLEKAVALHDYLAVNCEYDKENLDANTVPDTSHSAYGVLVNRIAVCEGYALAYKYLLNQAGIECYMVTSEKMNHAWNLITLNGKHYQVDVTWDDPTWDLIGRVRHQYMFRSDNAFVNECEHQDWSVTKGSEVVDYKAVDTTYDTAFWLNCDSPLVLVDKDCYYVAFDDQEKTGVIKKTTLFDITGTGKTVCDIGKWTDWENINKYYLNAYSGLFQANNRLYYNDKSSIYSLSLDDIENDIDRRTEFTADTTEGYIYGCAFCQGKVLYSLHQNPNLSEKESLLIADINIEIEEPSEIPIESIEFDDETLTLVVGDIMELSVTITPDDVEDVAIEWESSNRSIVEVEEGILTAVSVGNCTITAIAGGKKAVCLVTVITPEDIAGGSYKNITWIIDADGKLTVTGKGDYAEYIIDDDYEFRAPWYENTDSIQSAEINVTGMTNASYMFMDCRNLKCVELMNFDTSEVTNMSGMFQDCNSLANLNVSRFDTRKVTNMSEMFKGCNSLTNLNVRSFDTGEVTYMDGMFQDCSSLTNLDLSSFDLNLVSDTFVDADGDEVEINRDLFYGCTNLDTIYTPYNLKGKIVLPKVKTEDIWYQSDGTEIEELPQYLKYSIPIARNKVPVIPDSYIVVDKVQTDYECEDVLSVGDLTVVYYCNDGTVSEVFDYKTNKNEIDMSTPGVKTLKISYEGLEETIELNVTPRILGEDIANGSYKDITWVIDSKGKLTVEGTGDFAEPSTGSLSGSHDINADGERAPWYVYRDSIKSAEINVKGMTDASYMFNLCKSLKSIELKGLDTGSITDMGAMFCRCERLESIDVSGFNTRNVTDMGAMFYRCLSLRSVDVSSFNTSKVTNMSGMFGECSSLKKLDVSGFDTSEVTSMSQMFWDCGVEELDVSGFDTRNVTSMSWMFSECRAKELDVSGFDTSKVTSMGWMFSGCRAKELDVSGFDTSKVASMDYMFYYSGGEILDLSNFNALNVSSATYMFGYDYGPDIIYTPYNLTISVSLPSGYSEDIWYQSDGTVITELPQNLPYSIIIAKNTIPTISNPYITAKKTKTIYSCGDALNTDDLAVMFYNSDGTIKVVTEYSTNASEIDMSVPGIKTLIVKYNGLTASVELEVTISSTPNPDQQGYTVTFDLQGHGNVLEEYTTYTEIQKGSTISLPTPPEAEDYRFTGWYKESDCKTLWDFEKDTVEEDTILYAGWELIETDPDPDKMTYKVTFDLQGHGIALEEYSNYTEIQKGSTITCPTSPEAEGYEFTGWYKEADCNTLWDFDKDTIEGDTILYAGWKKNEGSGNENLPEDVPDGLWIAQIKDHTYTGKAITPSVVVYYNKKRLTTGIDYTISYQNNTKAATASATKAPTVIVKGKGNYSGTKKATFTINKLRLIEENNLKAANIYPTGIKYTPIVTAGGNILKSGTDYKLAYCDAYGNELKKQPTKAGNYQLHITGKGSCEGEIIFSYTISETGGANMLTKAVATVNALTYGSKEPDVTLTVDGKTLKRDTDYIVSFANINKKGTATATFIGIGDYAGTIKKNFKVQAAAIQEKDITVAGTVAYEKGGAKAKVSVLTGGTELIAGTDYTVSYKNNTRVGTASVTIKGKGNYNGNIKKDFKVEPQSLAAEGIKIYVSDVQAGKKPAITVYDANGKKLSANSDYKAEIDKTAHQVTITSGKNGLYKVQSPIAITYQELEKGKLVTSVTLNKKAAGFPKYFEYTGKEVELKKDWLTVKAGKTVLKSDEYEVLGYVNNVQKGTATVIIQGCNGYGGIKMLNFKIKAKGLL